MPDAARERPSPMYRMPTAFGPALGPRQSPEGGRYGAWKSSPTRQVVARAAFTSTADAVEALLPPRLELHGDPVVSVTVAYLENVGWLAGGGYNIVTVELPAVPRGGGAPGVFVPVLWESLADPIITGREELGMSKLYAEIPDLVLTDDGCVCSASWRGYEFIRLQLTGLVRAGDSAVTRPSRTVYNHKYIPATGRWGEADVDYLTVTPPLDVLIHERRTGTAELTIRTATFEQLPTLFRIVNVLAALPVVEVHRGSLIDCAVDSDGYGQQRLDD